MNFGNYGDQNSSKRDLSEICNMQIMMKREKILVLENFDFFFENLADHSKFRLLALMLNQLDPDPH
jgi:hypothetical protein